MLAHAADSDSKHRAVNIPSSTSPGNMSLIAFTLLCSNEATQCVYSQAS